MLLILWLVERDDVFGRHSLREAWERSLMYAVESAAVCQELQRQAEGSRMRVLVTIFHAREFDSDNAVAGLKPVLDALKGA